MSYLSDLISDLTDFGVYDIALPFLLVFTLAFAILQKSKILGKDAKNFNVVVALVVGLIFIRNQYLVVLVNRFLPNVSLFIVVFLMLLLLVAIFIKEEYAGWGNNLMAVAGIVSILAIIWSLSVDYLNGRYILPDWLTNLDTGTKSIIIFIAIFVIIIWLVTKEKQQGEGGIGNFFEKIGKELKGEKT